MNLIKTIIIYILTIESRMILSKYKPFIVAVTGSVGKTSTKDAIYSVLKNQGGYVRKSEKSMNSDIGLPLTIIGVPTAWRSVSGWLRNMRAGFGLILFRKEYPDCLVLELGADHPGDIRTPARWLRPDIAVITRVSKTPVHVEFFPSPEDVFEEKASLATSVKKSGTVVLFADDDKVLSIRDRLTGSGARVISFGTQEKADVRGANAKAVYAANPVSAMPSLALPTGFSFDLTIGGATKPVSVLSIIGSTYQYPLLAAAAVGVARGMDIDRIATALDSYDAPKGRMNVLPGINESAIIDDTYNSSPDAAESALETLRGLACSGSKIAVLGDMMELGKYSSDEHRRIGREAARSCDVLVTVGQRSRATADEAVKAGMRPTQVHAYDSAADVMADNIPVVAAGDIILVKGSQSVRMERIVKALLRQPNLADTLLVRQEKEWLLKK